MEATQVYYVIISTSTHTIIAGYYSDSGVDLTKPGPDYDQSKLVHTTLPAEFLGQHHVTVMQSEKAECGYCFLIDQAAVAQMVKEQWQSLREQRDTKLRESDWRVMVSDRPISEEVKAAWVAYRQALRDLPVSITDPAMITWPVPPSS